MSEDRVSGISYLIFKAGTSSTETPTFGLRYLDGILQQQFIVETYEGAKPVSREGKWRDVPTETTVKQEG